MDYKFRAWDKKEGKFLKPYREQFTGNLVNTIDIRMDGSFIFTTASDISSSGITQLSGDSVKQRFEVLFHTGLRDINGLEIYEGDIVNGRWTDEIYQVVFSEGVDIGSNGGEYKNWITGFLPAYADGSFDESGDCEIMYDQMVRGDSKILGNIYENPELLEDD